MNLIFVALFSFRLALNLAGQLLQLGVFLALAHRTSRLLIATLLVWGCTAIFIFYTLRQSEIKKQQFLAEKARLDHKTQIEILFWESYFKVFPSAPLAQRLSELFQSLNNTEKADYYQYSVQSLFPPLD